MSQSNTRKRRRTRVAVALLVSAAAALVAYRLSFDRAAWLEDYAELRTHTAEVYANLEWATERRGVDVAALHRETQKKLEAASSNSDAREALSSFMSAFGDGHFQIHREKLSKRVAAWWTGLHAPAASAPLTASTPAAEACAALGFGDRPNPAPFALEERPDFAIYIDTATDVVPNPFSAGVLTLAGSRRLGYVRIPRFDEQSYLGTCEGAWEERRKKLTGACDDACREQFSYIEVPNNLLAALAAHIRVLSGAGIDALVVDVTGNGGGTDWCDPAARLLSSKALACPRSTTIKHPHTIERLEAMARLLDEDLRRASLSPRERALLEEAKRRLDGLSQEARSPCDRSALWDGQKPSCSLLLQGESYACGFFSHLPPGLFSKAESRGHLFRPSQYTYTEGVYDGRLIVLVDQNTASASEYFAAMLKDQVGATVVGEKTVGAGCGYTNGGVPITLKHSGLRVKMPDCVRYRRDGSNEVEGITPDVLVPWAKGDDAKVRAQKLVDALSALDALK